MGEVWQRHSVTRWSNLNLYGLVETCGNVQAVAGVDSENPRKYKVYRDTCGTYYFNFRGTRIDIEDIEDRLAYCT